MELIDNNESILSLSSKKILQMNYDILKELNLEKDVLRRYLSGLKHYRYVDELSDLKRGAFIKWIPIVDPEYLPLNHSGMIADIKIAENGIFIVSKNFMHRHYTFKMEEALVFQKLTSQEQLILQALDHLEKEQEELKKEEEQEEVDLEDN
jgi:hypothetical protein